MNPLITRLIAPVTALLCTLSVAVEAGQIQVSDGPTPFIRFVHTRVGNERGRIRRISIVALARKLLIAVWRYVTQGEVPEGAVLKAA